MHFHVHVKSVSTSVICQVNVEIKVLYFIKCFCSCIVEYVKHLCSCMYVQVRPRSSQLNRTLSSSSTACLSLRSSWATRSWMPPTSSSRRWSTSTPISPKRRRLASTAALRPSQILNSLTLDVVSVLCGNRIHSGLE